jgi:hypothetical protein
LLAKCFADPEIERLYQEGDKLSSHQTKHDVDHACQVRDLAGKVAVEIRAREPGLLDDWTFDIVIPLSAYLHDIGRAIDVGDHARAGAKWTKKYLSRLTLSDEDRETLPVAVINRVARIVACHRSEIVLKMDINDPAWAIVVLADKFVGDEERVRPWHAFLLSVLTAMGTPWIPIRRNSQHDRANFAIKKSGASFGEAEIRLDLTIDERVCKPSFIIDLYNDRFRACLKAADFLGYHFRLVFNHRRFSYQKEHGFAPLAD